jgi:ANTAR domain/GAF domain
MVDREAWLVATMTQLAEAPAAETGGNGPAYGLTVRLAEFLAPAEAGLLFADETGRLDVAEEGSSGRMSALVSVQAASGEGPCADSHRSGRPILNEPVDPSGRRWPSFARAASSAGFGTVSALPLRRHGQGIGVICVAAPGARRLAAADARLAQVLATTAAVTVAREREFRRSVLTAEELQRALDSRVLIEQAKGAAAARLGVTPDRAFELLRGYARGSGRKLAGVAAEVIDNRLPVHDLVVSYQAGHGQASRRRRAVHSSW